MSQCNYPIDGDYSRPCTLHVGHEVGQPCRHEPTRARVGMVPSGAPESEYDNACREIESWFPDLDHRQPLYLRIRDLHHRLRTGALALRDLPKDWYAVRGLDPPT